MASFLASTAPVGTVVAVNGGRLRYTRRLADWQSNTAAPGIPDPYSRTDVQVQFWVDRRPEKVQVTLP